MKQFYEDVNETVVETTLKNGMPLYIIEKPGFTKSYAAITANYGSLHNDFVTSTGELIRNPKGIAHFLEHKMFEKEDGDMFNAFSLNGASANAFTSYDRTSYLFTTVESLKENLLTLIQMIENPYFTEDTVQKEMGIIEEEIKMYQDQPNYRLYHQTINAMYHYHPVKYDIAGSIESINQITAEKLYDCYHAFYHPSNMMMVVAGDFNSDEMIAFINDHVTIQDAVEIPKTETIQEPDEVVKPFVESHLDVQMPKLMIGIKSNLHKKPQQMIKYELLMFFAMDMLFGEQTTFYQSLLDEELIDDTFGFNFTIEPTFSHFFIAGSTTNPDLLKEKIIQRLHETDCLNDEAHFNRLKRHTLGEHVSSMNSPEVICNQFIKYKISGANYFDLIPILQHLKMEEMIEVFKDAFDFDQIVDSRVQ